MIVLSYGYKLPQLDDTGDIFFPALEFDINQLNNHTHNGTDSARLAPTTQSISSGSWGAVAGQAGTYSQVVTMPTGFTYDATAMEFRLADGTKIFPTVTKTSASTYTVYTNDNTLSYVAVYSS